MKEITKLEELKAIELDIMKKIHAFCEEKSIIYFLSHGTLIGAIRHKGFIPWDDDIDIFMPRKDYEKFCEIFPKSENALQLQLVNAKTSTYFARAMSKVIDMRTVLTEPEYKVDDPIGVFIDIWPLDGVPNNRVGKQIHRLFCKSLLVMFLSKIRNYSAISKWKEKLLYIFTRLISHKYILNKLEREIKKYDYSHAREVSCLVDPYLAIMDKAWFSTRELVPFEDAFFYVPGGYDKVLSYLYGNYMEMPPVEKRVPHHIINIYWK